MDYEFGKFNKAIISAVNIKEEGVNNIAIKKLLVRFNQLIQKLKKQLKELNILNSVLKKKK